ncbi:serine hydrolase [uncultured Limosilactobacillus sp.]|uniref:D-alanyl-D-alanine carboxypeptidase family protein n=1 Tax=uncultured Limosilactobacillus sp. TaxID=2837629 RepID=UPI0025E96E9C|nr:serine hydrolase [uncultured Limosilactobacillus sp.]
MKKIIIILLSCLLGSETVVPVRAQAKIDASAAIMVDASTGQIIYEQNANKKLPIASITKLLTMAVIYDQLDHHSINYNTKVKVTPAIAEISNNPLYSKVGLQRGNSYSVKTLINAAMVKSADGATVALALASGKPLSDFTMKMNEKARVIGLRDYTIINPTGLTNDQMLQFKIPNKKANLENQMTAHDVAILTRYLVSKHPEILRVTARPTAKIPIAKDNVTSVANLNQMLPGGTYSVPGMTIDGLKTGTSAKAGACFVSTGLYQGHRIITVVLHTNGANPDNRFIQTQNLYQSLKTDYHLQSIRLPQRITKQRLGKSRQRYLATQSQQIHVWVSGKMSSYTLALDIDDRLLKHQELQPPIKRGERLGTVTLTSPGVKSVNGDRLDYPLYSQQTVHRQNILQRLFQ